MRVLVYGTGIMGKGISFTLASNNIKVLLTSRNFSHVLEAIEKIISDAKRLYDKNKITFETFEMIKKNIIAVEKIDGLSEIDLVIETVAEDLEIKKTVIKKIENALNRNVIIATNTSSLSISEIACFLEYPDRLIGMHFFNPAPIMELIEVVRGKLTSDITVTMIVDLAVLIKKEIVIIDESPGFIVNRMLIPFINDAIILYSEGIAKAEDIDKAMKLGANHPIGPLALADLIGLDICLKILNTLFDKLGEEKYKPSKLLVDMVEKNLLGRKTKIGFYNY